MYQRGPGPSSQWLTSAEDLVLQGMTLPLVQGYVKDHTGREGREEGLWYDWSGKNGKSMGR